MGDGIITTQNNIDPEYSRFCRQHRTGICSTLAGHAVAWIYGEFKWPFLGEKDASLKLRFSYDLILVINNHRHTSISP